MKLNYTLLHNYLSGHVSEDEKKRIIEWLEEDKAHEQELKSLSLIYEAAIWNQDKTISNKTSIMHNRNRSIVYTICKIVAIFLLGFSLHYLIPDKGKEKLIDKKILTFYAPAGQHAELILEDGTLVWLNANSKITYPAVFNSEIRNVSLIGEAYFKVTPNKHKPFIVNIGNYKVRVLGTEFNILAYSHKNYVIDLLKGSVNFMTPDKKYAEMMPGDRICIHENRISKERITDIDYYKWREGLICFNSESIHDIFNKISLYYDVKIVCNNKHLLNSHYTGKFRVRDGIDHIMKVIQLDTNFKYNLNKDRNTITVK